MPYAVLRPAILFGGDGVLINNIAWLLRHLPVFGVGGRGDYRIRAIHVDDLADSAVEPPGRAATTVIDAVGPERPTFLELVHLDPGRGREPDPDRPGPRPGGPVFRRSSGRPPRRPAHGRRVPGHGRRPGRHRRPRDRFVTISEWSVPSRLARSVYANEIDRHFRRRR